MNELIYHALMITTFFSSRHAKFIILIIWSIGELSVLLKVKKFKIKFMILSTALATASPIPIVSLLNQPTEWFKKCDR